MISMYLTDDDQIMVCYPDGQRIPIPSSEPSRIVAILRHERDKKRPVDKLLAFRREFQAAFTHKDIVEKGAQVRKNAETKAEREKRARMKRIEKRDRLKAANELLAIVGL